MSHFSKNSTPINKYIIT